MGSSVSNCAKNSFAIVSKLNLLGVCLWPSIQKRSKRRRSRLNQLRRIERHLGKYDAISDYEAFRFQYVDEWIGWRLKSKFSDCWFTSRKTTSMTQNSTSFLMALQNWEAFCQERSHPIHIQKSIEKKCDLTSPVDSIQWNKEIMVHIYSFLPLKDRLFSMALVNRRLHEDPVRYGCLKTKYLGFFSIDYFVNKLLEWNRNQNFFFRATKQKLEDAVIAHSVTGKKRRALKKRLKNVQSMLSRKEESNLQLSILEKRARRLTNFDFRKHFQDEQKIHRHWLDDVVRYRIALEHYICHDEVCDRLGQWITELRLKPVIDEFLTKTGKSGLQRRIELLFPMPDGKFSKHKAFICDLCEQTFFMPPEYNDCVWEYKYYDGLCHTCCKDHL